MARDHAAIYARRKARAAASGTTVYKQQAAAARRLGYASYSDRADKRKRGELTPLDVARSATPKDAGWVTNIGGDRYTFVADTVDPASRAALNRALRRAANSPHEMRATVTADWKLPNGRRGTAAGGGAAGIDVDRIAGGLDDIEDELGNVGGSELPAGAQITSISIFFFPVGEAA